MKSKNLLMIKYLFVIFIVISLILSLLTFFLSKPLFIFTIILVVIVSVISIIKIASIEKDVFKLTQEILDKLIHTDKEVLHNLPLPAIVCDEHGKIIWNNDIFQQNIINNKEIFGMNFYQINNTNLDLYCSQNGIDIEYNDKFYRAYGIKFQNGNSVLWTIYFCEITNLKTISIEYDRSKPTVLIFLIDNYEELFQNVKESDKAKVIGKIDKVLENFISETTGFIKKLTHNKFIAIIEQNDVNIMIDKKFPILDKIRQITVENINSPTLSIGIGINNTNLLQSELAATQALDMALGRGGDQVAIKNDINYEFFGGVSNAFEKRTKVKTRMIATAMIELIKSSDNIIVMGHKFSDMDCIGSAIGIASAIRNSEKDVNIIINKNKSLACPLIDYIEQNSQLKDLFISPKQALQKISSNTTLIIVDTHNPNFLESIEVYNSAKTIIVIDHHRKMVKHIDNAVIFYHEPYASSTSEMVTELIQYFNESYYINKIEAEALLAGIMLDTRNFILRTGVRTFEAAAILKKIGADPISVKKLFANTMDAYQIKSQLISSAEIYKKFAIAYSGYLKDELRVVCPQAADDLLEIKDVDASIVIFESEEGINVSARSMGDINVQVIMEKLGGGGHQTMAAAQLKDTNIDEAKDFLFKCIDDFYNDKTNT